MTRQELILVWLLSPKPTLMLEDDVTVVDLLLREVGEDTVGVIAQSENSVVGLRHFEEDLAWWRVLVGRKQVLARHCCLHVRPNLKPFVHDHLSTEIQRNEQGISAN